MITLDMVKKGYETGIVRLMESPNGDGVVCGIGDNWFYFGGHEAEGSTVEEYQRNVPAEVIVGEVFDVLDAFRHEGEEFLDEYLYYFYFLTEQLKQIDVDATRMPEGEPRMYFTVRDGNGNDVGDERYLSFEQAMRAFHGACRLQKEQADGAFVGVVFHGEDKSYRCAVLQNECGEAGGVRMRPMIGNISEMALAVPEIELAALRAVDVVEPYEDGIRERMGTLMKQLGIYEKEMYPAGDLYVGKWRVHVVAPGAQYGAHNKLVYNGKQSLVEFWDLNVDGRKFPEGQLVARYHLPGLLSDKWGNGPKDLMKYGLCLDGLNPNLWSLSGSEMRVVFDWLKNRELLPGERYLAWRGEVDCNSGPMVFGSVGVPLAALPQVRNVHDVEGLGYRADGVRYTYAFGFDSQAPQETVVAALGKAFDAHYGCSLAFEEKVVGRPERAQERCGVFSVSEEVCGRIVDDAVANIGGIGLPNSSGYYELNSFFVDGEHLNLCVDIGKIEEENGELAYSVYYAVEFDGGDNLFADWLHVEQLDDVALKKAVFELANTDFSEDIRISLRQKTIDAVLGIARNRSLGTETNRQKQEHSFDR